MTNFTSQALAEFDKKFTAFGNVYADKKELKSFLQSKLEEAVRETLDRVEEELNKRQVWLQSGSPQLLTKKAYWLGVGFDSCLTRVKEAINHLKKGLNDYSLL